MDKHSLKALEYDRIIEILSRNCYSDGGRRLAESLIPSADKEEIQSRQEETAEYREIIKYEGGAGLSGFPDVLVYLARISAIGSHLSGLELLKIVETASLSTNVRNSLSGKRNKYPAVWKVAQKLGEFKELISEIRKVIGPDGEVVDNASKELSSIRRRREQLRVKINEKLGKIISSREASLYLSDRLITMRDGRYVIPVKDEHKSYLKGIVHDSSSSGATVFVEPLAVLPLNNRLRELESEEKREIERILIAVGDSVRGEGERLIRAQKTLEELDFIHSRALFSEQCNGVKPEIASESEIILKNARHPLLFIGGSLSYDKVVPLNFKLGGEIRSVIITGPNTGGKTVALKTVGLFVFLAQSGLQLPASYASLAIFKNVIADIGDEQSIAMSLSTFSGHIKQISRAIDSSGNDTLILLDELGGGTDPVEGAALGEAVIEHIVNSGALAVITTHLGALKTLASENSRIRNASMEFDRETLTPTYRFLPDIPGSSYALEVAEKLGVSQNVLSRAEKLLKSEHRDLSKLVARLQKSLAETEREREKLLQSRKAVSELEKFYHSKLEKIKQWEKQSDKLALDKLRKVVGEGEKEMEELLQSIKKSKADKEAVKSARRIIQKRKDKIEEKLMEIDDEPILKLETVSLGEIVYLNRMKTTAEVISLPNNKNRLKVRAGNLVLEVGLSELSQPKSIEEPVGGEGGVKYEQIASISPEIDIRGLTFEEAQPILERYLEDVYLADIGSVRIIHGKGTGALRKKVSEYLRSHKLIKGFRLGNFNEGGAGATVVEINKS